MRHVGLLSKLLPMRRLLIIALAATFALGCKQFEGEDHPTSDLRFPVGIAADPDQRHLYVANSNFDLAFLGGNIVVLDIDTHQVVEGASVQTRSFGGKLAVMPNEDGDRAMGLYMTAREDNTVTWIKVNRVGDNQPSLKCTDDPGKEGRAQVCSGKFVFGDDEGEETAGGDPFGAVVVAGTASAPPRLMTASFEGKMSIFDLDEIGQPTFQQHATLEAGSYEVAVHPVSRNAYATTKLLAGIDRVVVSKADKLLDGSDPEKPLSVVATRALSVINPTLGRDFGRGIAFNQDGTRLYAAYRTPPSLLVVDTTLDAGGSAADKLVDSIAVGDSPAGVAVAKSAADGTELVYVTLFSADKVAVVDPRRNQVAAIIKTGDAPFDITIVDRAEPRLLRAYVTLFEEGAVSVIELDPASPFYHQEIARIP